MNERESLAARLAALWSIWHSGGSIPVRYGITKAVELFREMGPFTVNAHWKAGGNWVIVNDCQFGTPDYPPALYRGASVEGRDGMSWTDDVPYALLFAWDTEGQVFTCEFEPRDFLARIRFTYEDNPTRTDFEWIMHPNSKAVLWKPPWLASTSLADVLAEHERLKRDVVNAVAADGKPLVRLRRAELAAEVTAT
jgi:hypothetical protein